MKKIRQMMQKLRQNKLGQGMTEYIIIVALIAIAAITVISVFGDNIRGQFANAASAIGGGDGKAGDEILKDDVDVEKRGMKNFNEGIEGEGIE